MRRYKSVCVCLRAWVRWCVREKKERLKFGCCDFSEENYFSGKTEHQLFNASHVSLSNLGWFVCFSVLFICTRSLLIHLSCMCVRPLARLCACERIFQILVCSFHGIDRYFCDCKVETIRKCVSRKVAKQCDDNNETFRVFFFLQNKIEIERTSGRKRVKRQSSQIEWERESGDEYYIPNDKLVD